MRDDTSAARPAPTDPILNRASLSRAARAEGPGARCPAIPEGLAAAPMPTASPRHRVRALPALFLSSLLWTGAVAGCAREAPPTTWQPGNLQPLTLAWQQFFSVQWTATPRSGTTLIEGYITNTWGFVAQDVRVLVNGFDSSGSPVGQMIAWGPNDIEPGGSKYFDVTVPSGAATYDVSVFSWKWKWPPSGGTEPRERRTSAHARAVDRREP